MEQGQLLAAVHPVDPICEAKPASRPARRAIMRLSVVFVGRFSRRHIVGCEQSSAPVSGRRPTAILKAGSKRKASQSLASGQPAAISSARKRLISARPCRRSLGCSCIGDAAGQPLGDPEPPLDLRQHQNAGIRGQPTTVKAS